MIRHLSWSLATMKHFDRMHLCVVATMCAACASAAPQPAVSAASTVSTAPTGPLTYEDSVERVRATIAHAIADAHGFSKRGVRPARAAADYEQIRGLKLRKTSDLLAHMLRTRIVETASGSQLYEKYGCQYAYYIDGKFDASALNLETLDAAAPIEGLAAVEIGVYSTEYPEVNGFNCGVILFWMLPPELWGGTGGG